MTTSTIVQGAIPSQSGLEQPPGGIENQIRRAWSYVSVIDRTEPLDQYRCPATTAIDTELNRSASSWHLLWRLVDLHSTPEDERLPHADWPTEAAFSDAWAFIDQLPGRLKVLPHISLADDGEVNFTWGRGAMHIDLGFYGNGTFSYYARDDTRREFFGDDIPVRSPLPKNLKTLLDG